MKEYLSNYVKKLEEEIKNKHKFTKEEIENIKFKITLNSSYCNRKLCPFKSNLFNFRHGILYLFNPIYNYFNFSLILHSSLFFLGK